MAKHKTPKQRRARKAMIAGAATAGVSGALVLAQGMDVGEVLVNLTSTNTVIGIGGRGDATSTNVPAKLNGLMGFGINPPLAGPNDPRYIGIHYPAGYDLGNSRDAGVPTLDGAIRTHSGSSTDPTVVVGYSEGTLVAEQERRNLQAMPVGTGLNQAPAGNTVTFEQIASPFAGNGGLFARFPETPTFLLVDNMGPAEPTRYNTNYVVNEYDPYGDFPAYFNPLSLANSALAVEYAHPDQYYNAIDPATSEKLGPTKTLPANSQGGIDTYTIYKNQQLPLLGPIRQGAALIGVGQYVEPELQLVEPTLRVLIDAGYTDRTNADPATPTPFSLITPPQNIIGAAAALPGAAQEGVQNFLGGGQSPAPFSIADSSTNKTIAPDVTPKPAAAPKPKLLPTLPKLPTFEPLQQDPPKTETPALDALNVDPPKLPKPSISSTPRRGLNLGLLVPAKPTVFAGDSTSTTKPPTFGGGQPAGVISGALKKLADGLTGKKPADAASPETKPAA